MAEQWRRFREKLRLCDPVVETGDLDGSEILPIVVGEATRWIRLDRLIEIARALSPAPPPVVIPPVVIPPAAPPFTSGTIGATVGAVPDGWLKCDGALVSRVTYPKLFAAIGITFGKGNGTTTFALPTMKTRLTTGNAPDATWMIAV
jgi:hypothetical protein